MGAFKSVYDFGFLSLIFSISGGMPLEQKRRPRQQPSAIRFTFGILIQYTRTHCLFVWVA